MEDHGIVDTYCAHLAAGNAFETEQLRIVRRFNGKIPERFHTLKSITLLLQVSRRIVGVIMSLGRYHRNGKYILQDDAGNEDHSILFQELNEVILAADPASIPPGAMPFAIVAGKEPDAMLPSLELYGKRFCGLKIPAFSLHPASDSRYEQILAFAEARNWPVLIHCSENPQNPLSFQAARCVAEEHPRLRVTASHLGGDNPAAIESNVIPPLRDGDLPLNLWLNTAVHHTEMLPKILEAGGEKRIVFASDIPFFHPHDHISAIRCTVGGHAENVLCENGLRSLGLV